MTLTVSNQSPANGADIYKLTPVEFDVTDTSGITAVEIKVTQATLEVIFDGYQFQYPYQSSRRTAIPNGWHYLIIRTGGWAILPPDFSIEQIGSVGPAGPQGPPGVPYSTTTASFVMPEEGDTVQVHVNSAVWMIPLPAVFIESAGIFSIESKDSSTIVTLRLIANLGSTGDTITLGKTVVATGIPGHKGDDGTNGKNAFGTCTSGYTQPNVGSDVTLGTTDNTWIDFQQIVFLHTGGYYQVNGKPDTSHTIFTNLGYPFNPPPGTDISSGQTITAAGLMGPSPQSGKAKLKDSTGALDDATVTITGVTLTSSSLISVWWEAIGDNGSTGFSVMLAPASLRNVGAGSFVIAAFEQSGDAWGQALNSYAGWAIFEP